MGQLKIFGKGKQSASTSYANVSIFLGSYPNNWKPYRPTGAAGHFVLDWPMQGILCILIE